MENTMYGGQAPSPAYDFRVYDRVWQRVSPGTDPFAADPASAGMTEPAQESAPAEAAPAAAPAVIPAAVTSAAVPAARQEAGDAALPGAEPNPCCMGTEAEESLEVLEGFMQEELAESRCCQSLACRVRNQKAAQAALQGGGGEKAAARELCAAYYLITGVRYNPAITVEHMCWENLPQALRSFYHQEACNGLNYERAADEAIDVCLKKLLGRLSEQSYQRAEDMMTLLGKIVCC